MKPEAGARVLVTGATGFLGGAVVRDLAARGVPVLAQGRDPAGCDGLQRAGHPVLRWDISAPYRGADLPELAQIGAVVHCAALTSPFGTAAAFELANVEGTRNVLALARRCGARRFVLVSSPSVYFALRDLVDVAEDMPLPRPFNHYARTKRIAEGLVLGERALGPVVLRPRGIYGAGDTVLLPRLLRAARNGALPLLRGGRARIDLTHVGDVVAAIRAALAAGDGAEGEVFNISGGVVLPVTEIVEQLCARAGVPVRWRRVPLAPAMAAVGCAEALARLRPNGREPAVTRYGLALFAYAQGLNITKARRGLGWEPGIDFDTGLDRTFSSGTQP